MLRTLPLLGKALLHEAISTEEFLSAFKDVWRPIPGPGGGSRPRIGMCT